MGEQINRVMRAGLKRADNVGVTIGVGAAVSGANPFAGVAAGVLAGHEYGNSPADEAFDSAIDVIADELQSPTMGVPLDRPNTAGYTLDQGLPAFNRTIR